MRYADPRSLETPLGWYGFVGVTGTIAAGASAASEILQLWWDEANKFAAITEVKIVSFRAITGFTAGAFIFDLFQTTAHTAAGSGGAAIVQTAHQLQLRPVEAGVSEFGDIRIATTGALTAGTQTLFTRPVGSTRGWLGTAANQQVIPAPVAVTTDEVASGPGVDLFKALPGEHPIILEQNTGLVVKATVPATGTWVAAIAVKWAEYNDNG